jgi:hypothetical protein
MTYLEGLPSYFWLVPPRMKASVRDDVPYTTQALREDLLRVQNAWNQSQARRERSRLVEVGSTGHTATATLKLT